MCVPEITHAFGFEHEILISHLCCSTSSPTGRAHKATMGIVLAIVYKPLRRNSDFMWIWIFCHFEYGFLNESKSNDAESNSHFIYWTDLDPKHANVDTQNRIQIYPWLSNDCPGLQVLPRKTNHSWQRKPVNNSLALLYSRKSYFQCEVLWSMCLRT